MKPSPIALLILSCTISAPCAAAAAASANRANYDEARVGNLPLPDPLVASDGTRITTREGWITRRRPEVLELFRTHVYGHAPALAIAARPRVQVVATKPDALGGIATRKILRVTLESCPRWAGLEILLLTPNDRPGPVPVFCGLNFGGNHAVLTETDLPLSTRWMRDSRERGVVDHRATEASRGTENSRWQPDLVVRRGFALATAYYGDIEPDHAEGWKDGVRGALSPKGAETTWAESDWGAIGAWAWGLSRMLDALETEPGVDARRASVIGHSRLGKTALWAGAQDERWAIVISNNSGEGGASLMRRDFGETTEIITRAFPHWFAPRYRTYAGNAGACPVDQHMLVALVAPRPAYVASAAEDQWADPKGEFLAAKLAGPVYALLGKPGLGADEQPPIDHPIGDAIGYHIRTGKHNVTEYDWQQYLAFAERHLRR